jgi:hypothetical protein
MCRGCFTEFSIQTKSSKLISGELRCVVEGISWLEREKESAVLLSTRGTEHERRLEQAEIVQANIGRAGVFEICPETNTKVFFLCRLLC